MLCCEVNIIYVQYSAAFQLAAAVFHRKPAAILAVATGSGTCLDHNMLRNLLKYVEICYKTQEVTNVSIHMNDVIC